VQVRLVPRFPVEQGVLPDGSKKFRSIDNFSWSAKGGLKRRRSKREVKESSINGQYGLKDAVQHDHLDDLLEAMRLHFATFAKAKWCSDVSCNIVHMRCVTVLAGAWPLEGRRRQCIQTHPDQC